MPIMNTDSVTLAESAGGALSAAMNLATATGNDLVVATPGLYAYQRVPAVAAMFAVPGPGAANGNPSMTVPSGGASAVFTPIPYSNETFEDDGLPAITPSIMNAAAGRFGPVVIPGYYAFGVAFHGGDPLYELSPSGLTQLVVQTDTSGAMRQVASSVRGTISGSTALAAARGKWPFTAGSAISTGGTWPLLAGNSLEFAVRQLGVATAVGEGVGVTPAKPWLFSAWCFLLEAS